MNATRLTLPGAHDASEFWKFGAPSSDATAPVEASTPNSWVRPVESSSTCTVAASVRLPGTTGASVVVGATVVDGAVVGAGVVGASVVGVDGSGSTIATTPIVAAASAATTPITTAGLRNSRCAHDPGGGVTGGPGSRSHRSASTPGRSP